MTVTDARRVFSEMMERSRYRSLTMRERAELRRASQMLRASKRGKLNPGRRKANPGRVIKIYGKVLRVEAEKTGNHHCDAECRRCGHRYYHDFKIKPTMYGLPDGSILIKKD